MNRLSRQLGIGLLALTLIVLVGCGDETVGSAPGNFTLTASSDGLSVRLSWEEPADGQPDNYIVYFMEVNTTDWVVEATLDGNVVSFTHDPSGMTGDYYVAADFGGDEYDSPTLTTVPVHTPTMTIYELEAGGNSGYGWGLSSDFTGTTYSMDDAANAALVDFYIDPDKCTGCTLCLKKCSVEAIAGEPKKAHSIDRDKCVRCGQCIASCRFEAIYTK